LVDGFLAVVGPFFFPAVTRVFFFGSGALSFPLAEGAAASSAGWFSIGVFDFLGTVFSAPDVVRPNTAWRGGASGFCKAFA
jgi:hypothetical protein